MRRTAIVAVIALTVSLLAAPVAASSASAASAKCTSKSYTLNAKVRTKSWNWYYHATTKYKGQGIVASAATTIKNGNTNCSKDRPNAAKSTYKGTTSRKAGTKDGYSVVGWAHLGKDGPTAQTYSYTTSGKLTGESDVVFNIDYAWYTGSSTTGCSKTKHQYDLRATATHELGHVFGLAHTSASSQVMYASAGYCETSKRWLGNGDALGLVKANGAR